MSMSTVTINSGWLAGMTAPYVLNQPNTRYVLAQDINATNASEDSQVFILSGTNIELDTAGFYITLNGESIQQITDTTILRRTSEYATRPFTGNTVNQYGTGIYSTGSANLPIIPPGEYPPVVPYGQTS